MREDIGNMLEKPLSEFTSNDVRNVLIFISDSLRFDSLPSEISKKGVKTKTIAAAPWTASSIPSMMTGQYPSNHCVWMFEDRLEERPPLLREPNEWMAGFDSEKHWPEFKSGNKPPIRMLQLDGEQRIEDLEPPFVHVIHDLGPHAPYGFENDEYSTGEYFQDYNDPEDLRRRYEEDASRSAQYFSDVIQRLEQEDLFSQTLCVFTSDHGELLGEGKSLGGKWGHSTPLCPELLEVPTVFCGAGLPSGELLSGLVSGVDLAPTCLSAVGRDPGRVDGIDLWSSKPGDNRIVRADVWQQYSAMSKEWPVYAASSLWDDDGGWVYHRRSRFLRTMYYLYDIFQGDYAKPARKTASASDIISGIRFWAKSWKQFGNPNFSQSKAKAELSDNLTKEGSTISMNEDQQQQLKDLGYI